MEKSLLFYFFLTSILIHSIYCEKVLQENLFHTKHVLQHIDLFNMLYLNDI